MGEERLVHVESLDDPAIAYTLRRWRNRHPWMGVLALAPEAERERIPRLQATFLAEGVPLVGAVFPALVVRERFETRGVWLLRFDQMPYSALHADLAPEPGSQGAVAETIAQGLRPFLSGPAELTLFLVFDALFPSVASLLDELYLRLANRVRYAGANAGSETFKPLPCLFDARRIVQGGVLALLLPDHRGGALEHGYEVPTRMTTATSTQGNRVVQIDWRPAFDVYQALGREQYGVEIDRGNFYRHAVHFPFGIVRANGVILVRIPVALEEDGSLFCVGEVPANSVLTLLRAPAVDSARTVHALERGLAELAGPADGGDLLLFYCAGRRLHLGVEAAAQEVRLLRARTRAGAIAGALSLGEIGSSSDSAYPFFHNGCLLALRWGSRPPRVEDAAGGFAAGKRSR